MSHLKVTQAGVVAVFTALVGQLVAFVPAFTPDKQILLSAGSTLIAAAFLGANAVHHLADSNVSAKDVEVGAINAAKAEVGKVNFNQLVSDAVNAKGVGGLEALVKGEVQRILAGAFSQSTSAGSAPSIPAVPPAVTGA